jgi:hypothetical protein
LWYDFAVEGRKRKEKLKIDIDQVWKPETQTQPRAIYTSNEQLEWSGRIIWKKFVKKVIEGRI